MHNSAKKLNEMNRLADMGHFPAVVNAGATLNVLLTITVTWFIEPHFFGSAAMGHAPVVWVALVLLLVETTDLIFAVDSIPAIFAVTQKAFIVFTSNVFAILGLRSLYFTVAGAMQYFRCLKTGLAVVLVFVGLKMLAARWYSVPALVSLAVVAGIMAVSVWLSMIALKKKKRT